MELTFTVKNKIIEVFFAQDGHVEIYDVKNPGKTGFSFGDRKELYSFINGLTDVAEQHQKE